MPETPAPYDHASVALPPRSPPIANPRRDRPARRTGQADMQEVHRSVLIPDASKGVPPSSLKLGTSVGESLEKAGDSGGLEAVDADMSTGDKAGQDFLRLMQTSSGPASRCGSEDRVGPREDSFALSPSSPSPGLFINARFVCLWLCACTSMFFCVCSCLHLVPVCLSAGVVLCE